MGKQIISSDYLKNAKRKSGYSLISCCKDRNENLKNSLESWVKIKKLNEIVIVDWSSYESIAGCIPTDTNGVNIKLVVAPNQKDWVLSHAYNLGAYFVEYNKMLKVDADVQVSEDFFDVYKLKRNLFYRGSWMVATNCNEQHLNGQFYCYTNHFWKVNGYHEGITSYGWDDDDLYFRLKKLGIADKYLYKEHLYHQPTSHRKRIQNQSCFSRVQKIKADIVMLENSVRKNQVMTKEIPWLPSSKRISWDIKYWDNNIWECTYKT